MYPTISPCIILNDSTRVLADLFYRLSSFNNEFTFRITLRLGQLQQPMPTLSSCMFHQKCYGESTRIAGNTYNIIETVPPYVFELLLYTFAFPGKKASGGPGAVNNVRPENLPPPTSKFRRTSYKELNMIVTSEIYEDGHVVVHKCITHEFISSTLVCGGATNLVVEQVSDDKRAVTAAAEACMVYQWTHTVYLGTDPKDGTAGDKADIARTLPLTLIFEIEETTFETQYLFRVEVPNPAVIMTAGIKELEDVASGEGEDVQAVSATQEMLPNTLFWRYGSAILRLQAGIDRILSSSWQKAPQQQQAVQGSN